MLQQKMAAALTAGLLGLAVATPAAASRAHVDPQTGELVAPTHQDDTQTKRADSFGGHFEEKRSKSGGRVLIPDDPLRFKVRGAIDPATGAISVHDEDIGNE